MNHSAVISEVNLVGGNTKEWWVDTGVTRHVCSEKKLFSTYNLVGNGRNIFMGNSSTSKIEGIAKVVLKMTTSKFFTLKDVLHVPKIQKNLVSGSLLSKNGFKLVFESDKFSLFKSGMYVGKGYLSNGMFKMNVMTVIDNNKGAYSVYMLESSNVWHVVAPIPKRIKMGPKTIDCVFISYTHSNTAYRFLIYKSEIPDLHVNTIIESKNSSFFEEIFPYKSTQESSSYKRNFESTSSTSHDQELIEEMNEVEPKHSKRAKTSKSFGPNFLTYTLEDEPQSFKEAISTPKAPFWKEAVNSKIESILQNHTWEVVDLPPGCKPLGHKWIFKRKLKADGSIDKYKARLVVKGYKQKEGVDYFETYSPVTRITSIWMLIAITALHNLEIHQMDVKTRFLNGELNEEIYMEQLDGLIFPSQERKCASLLNFFID
ncbi:uncharacterized protein LOC142612270 [Castanea sativa]|uniref:uncharacterized protein LOC142612270 n=1 Tax=Castanea sativa TaxID=21020 RepID=UPI003F64A20D